MTRNFGNKIMMLGMLIAFMLMASVGSAFAVMEEYNGLPVVGYQNIQANPAPDAQYVIAQNNFDVASVEVLIRDFGICGPGMVAVDLNIHNGVIGAPVLANQRIMVPRCFAGPVRFNFPAAGPFFALGNLYSLDVNSPTIGAAVSWAYTNNALAPGVGLSLWDSIPNFGNDYKFAIFS